ncbi:hypothetical protein [Hyphobacterium sp.]|jgi:hypothetical protein|uniref:hypothetical protein n=1 Tax=Hyphobacterium sp. TaxID=2004662 RepID=UPI003BAD6532
MRRIASRVKQARAARPSVAYAPDLTTSIVLVAALFAILQTFSAITMEDRAYYDWFLANRGTSGSLLGTITVMLAALAALFLADIVRPKPGRVAAATRLFQFLLIGAMVSVSLIQWGMLLPHEPVAGPARHWQLALQRTPLFQVDSAWIGPERESPNPQPVRQDETMWHVSPFAEKAGILRAEADQEVWINSQSRREAYWNAVQPDAITEPPKRPSRAPP